MSATAPGLASANFTESGAYRRTNVFSLATIMSGLVPSMVRVLMVTSPALASTAVTRPPTPRFCHSAWSACCFLAMSALVITTRVVAASEVLSSDSSPRANRRSPGLMSLAVIGVAFAIFSPGGTRRNFAPACGVIFTVLPSSVCSVIWPFAGSLACTAPTRFVRAGCCPGAIPMASHTTAAQRKSLIFITEETPNCKDVGEGGQGYGGGGKMLIGKPVSPSTRQPIPQPVHRQYPLRLVGIFLQLLPQQLQSTPPARAATRLNAESACILFCFNPRRPRGRRQGGCPRNARLGDVSIHAARARPGGGGGRGRRGAGGGEYHPPPPPGGAPPPPPPLFCFFFFFFSTQ